MSVEMAIQILQELQELEGAGVTVLANETGTTKATVHNHLKTLEEHGLVVQKGNNEYDIGLRFLSIARYAKSRFPILDIVESEIEKLAEKSNEVAVFTVEEHWRGITVAIAHGEKAVQTPAYVGKREYLHNTAIGKAILAHKPREEVEYFLDEHDLKDTTENAITDREEFLDELETIRDQGIAYNQGESIQGLVGIGAPVKYHDGTVAGAISIFGPASRMDEDRLKNELADMITRSVNIIEVNSTSLSDD